MLEDLPHVRDRATKILRPLPVAAKEYMLLGVDSVRFPDVKTVKVRPPVRRIENALEYAKKGLECAMWGWYNIDELNDVAHGILVSLGNNGILTHPVQFETFFPVTHPEKGPWFTWAVVEEDGLAFFSRADMLFCPFPNATNGPVLRHPMQKEDQLLVPADWGNCVLGFVEQGIVEITCPNPKSDNPAYFVRTFNQKGTKAIDSRLVHDLAGPGGVRLRSF